MKLELKLKNDHVIYPHLTDILPLHEFKMALLDASGVLYTDSGLVNGVPELIKTLQQSMPVFLVTNNSNNFIIEIAGRLERQGVFIPESHIISSGYGLSYDPRCQSLIQGKSVFVYGYEKSYPYVELAKPKEIVQNLDLADVIVFTSSFKEGNDERKAKLVQFMKENPNIPMVCCNPDRFVKDINMQKYYVCGQTAEDVSKETGLPVYFVGKPLENFSVIVKKIIEDHGYTLGDDTLFVDDNPHNVIRLQEDLGITGICATGTGIYPFLKEDDFFNKSPTYYIESL